MTWHARWPTYESSSCRSGKNLGFAQGVNLGLRHCSQPYVLILNDDATLDPGTSGTLVAEMEHATPDVIGLAPKVLLDSPEAVIDNVGAAITSDGSVHNRGYDQKDVGQFDEQVDVAGLCFAATLLRREGFEASRVGPLDGRYFMYAEDSDWCLRARLRGYRFVSCPEAVSAARTLAQLGHTSPDVQVAAYTPKLHAHCREGLP